MLKLEYIKNLIIHWAAQHNVRWHFSPARAPHFGGLWEAAVRKMKTCLCKVVGQERLTLMELQTVPTAAEASVNSYPLSSIDLMNDYGVKPLTPFHFTSGRAPGALITIDG